MNDTPAYAKLIVYRKAFKCSMEISKAAKYWPVHERYSLTDQIRRSSRSVCSNIAERHAKRRYPKHFSAKASDALGESYETVTWLYFARAEGYLEEDKCEEMLAQFAEINRLLMHMIKHPEKFSLK